MHSKLDLDEDMEFQEKDWRAERIAWVFMALFVIAGLLGVFGRGGISNASQKSADNKMEVKYQRFLRYHTEDELEIKINRNTKSNSLHLLLGKAFNKKIQVQSIDPKPEKMLITEKGVLYIFPVAPALRKANITFYIKPEKMGSLQTYIACNEEGSQVQFNQYIYP
jgi:hypothetical protein